MFHATRLEFDLKDELDATREKWVHEDELVNQRVTWLLASQTFLIAAAGVVLFSENSTDSARTYLALVVAAVLGTSVTLWINRSLLAARRAMYFIASSSALHEYLRDVGVLERAVVNPEENIPHRRAALERFQEAWVRAVFHDLPAPVRLRLRIWRLVTLSPLATREYDWAFRREDQANPDDEREVSPELRSCCLRMFRLPSMNRLAVELAKAHGLDGTAQATGTSHRGDLPALGLMWATGFHADLNDLQWPYWRPDVTSGTTRGGDQAPTWMVRTFLILWVPCIAFGAFKLIGIL